MRCPDCGSALAELTQKKNWWLYRCFRCGGVLTNSETLNSITHADLVSWRRVGVDPRWLAGGDDKSPMDGLKMEVYKGPEIPPELTVKRSVRTGVWWLPGDTIFRLKEAQGVKVQYFRVWGQGQPTGLVLPLIAGLLLMGGLATGVYLSSSTQRVAVPAMESVEMPLRSVVSNVIFSKTDLGQMKISFKSAAVVPYVLLSDVDGNLDQVQVMTSVNEAGEYEAVLGILNAGSQYRVVVMGETYNFVAE